MLTIPNYQITKQSFELVKNAFSTHLQIPPTLYGREKELQTLLAAFSRVENQAEIMLIRGYSGIGKSALVNEFYQLIEEKTSYFVTGKFDQSQNNIPYSAIIKALVELVEQILTENEIQQAVWKDKLSVALGTDGQVIVEVIPKLELIIGKQPAIVNLTATESQNRFNLVLLNFIRVFCQAEQPLVIFLDNLQWADSATLQFLELAMTDKDVTALLLIGAFRDNEVIPSHPLIATFHILEKANVNISKITLKPLPSLHVGQLIAASLQQNPKTLESLTNLVMHKTEGNPFCVNQFLHILYKENLAEKYPHFSEDFIEYDELKKQLTERTQELDDAHAQLKTLQNKLIESEKIVALSSLIAKINSELNTPIGIGVTGASLVAERTEDIAILFANKSLKSSNLKNYFDTVIRSSRLVLNNLIKAAKLIQGFKQIAIDQVNFKKRPFAVKQYIENTLISLTPHLKKTQYQTTINGDKQLEIDSYPGAFSQIITNLVINSVKHAYPTQKPGHLSFEFYKESERLFLKYSDDGCGIIEDNLAKIFEPFFTTGQDNTGLGLYNIQNLVTQKLQGTIWVESEINKGTTFILNLPLQIK